MLNSLILVVNLYSLLLLLVFTTGSAGLHIMKPYLLQNTVCSSVCVCVCMCVCVCVCVCVVVVVVCKQLVSYIVPVFSRGFFLGSGFFPWMILTSSS